ncbi:MAG: helix-turn-helix domain-containing protein, partial [Bdellovibrionales bacterium]|nr:helix-turn-helix domain-containing protein [Bdellovibrionales bacterium]
NAHVEKATGRDKVKAEALEEQEEELSSSESSEEARFFGNRIGVITTEELAVIFGLAPQTIRNWTAQGKLPYVKIGRRNLFLMRSIKRWLYRKEEPLWE